MPVGKSSAGLPVSLQLIGRFFDDPLLMRVAYAYEHSTDWDKVIGVQPQAANGKVHLPVAAATASAITPASAPWRTPPEIRPPRNACSAAVARAKRSVTASRRAA